MVQVEVASGSCMDYKFASSNSSNSNVNFDEASNVLGEVVLPEIVSASPVAVPPIVS